MIKTFLKKFKAQVSPFCADKKAAEYPEGMVRILLLLTS